MSGSNKEVNINEKNYAASFFPVRHLSPNGAYALKKYLDKINPDIVLVEGPSDANNELDNIVNRHVVPPIAILAYTDEMPVKTILYPLASYSPEYVAIKWAKSNNKEVRFIDLPSDVFLAMENMLCEDEENTERSDDSNIKKDLELNDKQISNEDEIYTDIYETLYRSCDEFDYDAFWERNFEHLDYNYYRQAMMEFGSNLRQIQESRQKDDARNILREAFMKSEIERAVKEGYRENKMVIVTGAYHTLSLMSEKTLPLSEEEIKKLPRKSSKLTLMPYSYYRLSDRSGYGAGNKAPNYFEMMWKLLNENKLDELPQRYLTVIVRSMRKEGHIKSSAEVIEAVRLAKALSNMHGGNIPILQDLRDGAKTCLGEGTFSKIVTAAAEVEIGTKIGHLPEGMCNTSLQNNFNFMIKDLKLTSYKTLVATDVTLDLRENRRVKSEKSAFMDLNRSSFLHQLEVLNISFGKIQRRLNGDNNWKEAWTLAWRPETEIEIVEASLMGDTIEIAAAYVLKDRLDKASKIKEVSEMISKCYECGMDKMASYSINILQKLAVDINALDEISEVAFNLSYIIRFGTIRKIDTEILKPILSELFLRAALIMVECSNCDDAAAKLLSKSIEQLDVIAQYHEDVVNTEIYIRELIELSNRDDRNSKLSGIACSILIERGLIDKEMLSSEIGRRLLPGIPPDIGAGWFEGLACRNRYVILGNLTIWEKLDEYIMNLDKEEFKSAVVFLHRTFSTFNGKEKYMVAENLANLWGISADDLSEYLNEELSEDEEKILEDLDNFNFDDF